MDIGTIATLLALFVAVYALLPRYYWQELSLKIDSVTKVYLILIGLLLFLIQFKDLLIKITEKYHLSVKIEFYGADFWKLFSQQELMLFLLFLLSIPFLTKNKKLTRSNYQNFINLCHELFYREKYHEVLDLIIKNVHQIRKISNKESLYERLAYKLKTYIFTQSGQNISLLYELSMPFSEEVETSWLQKQLQKTKKITFKKIRQVLYPSQLHHYQRKTTFAESCEEIFNDQDFVDFLITRRSETILKIVQNDILEERSLNMLFYRATLNTNSFIFKEFKYSNFNNGVTEYLFKDPKKCESLGLWRPVGEAVIDYLDELSKLERSEDKYNGTMANFDAHDAINERVKSPIFVGIYFFKEMVHSAFSAEIEWHMWLYYYEHFLSRIVNNVAPHDPAEREFPSRYHFLIYELLNAMTDIIDEVSMYPEKANLKSAQFRQIDLDHDNGSIIKSAMKCLGRCTEIILNTYNLTDYDKRYFLDVIFHSYFRLAQNDTLTKYAEQYLLFIKYGGGLYRDLVKPEFITDYLSESDFRIRPDSYSLAKNVIDHYYDE